MALELLAAWGISAAWTCVFKPILEELAADTAKDWAIHDSIMNGSDRVMFGNLMHLTDDKN